MSQAWCDTQLHLNRLIIAYSIKTATLKEINSWFTVSSSTRHMEQTLTINFFCLQRPSIVKMLIWRTNQLKATTLRGASLPNVNGRAGIRGTIRQCHKGSPWKYVISRCCPNSSIHPFLGDIHWCRTNPWSTWVDQSFGPNPPTSLSILFYLELTETKINIIYNIID